jgi:hypothetical protein
VKVGLGVLGALIFLTGAVFAGQGLGYIKGSVMTGDMKWFWIGGALVLIGLALGWFGFVRRGKPA